MTAAAKRQRSSIISTLTVGMTACRISMRIARKRSMLGSTIETGVAGIRGRSAAAETPRMSICG